MLKSTIIICFLSLVLAEKRRIPVGKEKDLRNL